MFSTSVALAVPAFFTVIVSTVTGSVPVSYEHDANGRMSKLIDGEGNGTEFYYSCCWLTGKEYADGSSYSYAYSPQGWLELRTDPKGVTTEYSY